MALPYVYAILVDGVVRYIGKGRNERAAFHEKAAVAINARRAKGERVKALKFHNRLAKAMRAGAEIRHEMLMEFATDEEAFAYEVEQIATRNGLWNEADGGRGMTPSLAKKIWKLDGFRERMVARARERLSDPDQQAIMLKGRQRPEAKQKFKESMRLFWGSEQFIEIMRKNGQRVAANPANRQASSVRLTTLMAGRGKAIIAASNKRRAADPNQRAVMLAALNAGRERNNADPEFQAKRVAGIRAYWAKKKEQQNG